ncbi:glycoside hydrolase family 31 protein [Bacillaceae bacterium S4-13-56]
MLEETSFAIHPGAKKKLGKTSYHDIGSLIKFHHSKDKMSFVCQHGWVDVSFYREDIVRVIMNPKQMPDHKTTKAVIGNPKHVQVQVKETDENILLSSDMLQVEIQKNPFRVGFYDKDGRALVYEDDRGMGFNESGEVIGYKVMEEQDHFYGFGEKAGFLEKRGESYKMWNTDVYAPHNPETDPLYESIPYFMTLREGKAHGLYFNNTFKTSFDMKSEEDHYSFSAEGGQLDYFLFAGPTPKDVIEQYTYLTGRMPIPPKWALGYHQSRYSYETEQEVRELANTFKEKKIPVDVIYLDIHYMNEYRVFTFDSERFPSPKQMVQDLKEAGIRIVPIVDPGVKKEPEYLTYQEGVLQDMFCKYLEGDLYFGEVWPGISAFPDFTDEKVREWWGKNHKFYSDLGIEGIWNDMNEPAVFNESKTMDLSVVHRNDGDPKTHRELHNLYGFLMGEATYGGMKKLLQGKRPFLLTRAGFSGIQRYAAVWTGDNRSFWEHLQMSLPMCMNLGLSGVAFTGPDVGGFAHDTNAELLTRWTQVGAFTPYFRNHSAIGFRYQEPWQFGDKHEDIMRKFIELRYRWLPQLYRWFKEAHDVGAPVMRPLFLEYPNDVKTYSISDQFMIGDNVIIAPIMTPKTTDRVVYLPKGDWIRYDTEETFSGNDTHLIHAELDQLPIFIRKGSAIVHGNVRLSTMEPQTDCEIHVYPSEQGSYELHHYDDDGESFGYESEQFLKQTISFLFEKGKIEVQVKERLGEYQPDYQNYKIVFHDLKGRESIYINGKMQKIAVDKENQITLTVPIL